MSGLGTALFVIAGVATTYAFITAMLNCTSEASLGRWLGRIVLVGGGLIAAIVLLMPVQLLPGLLMIGAYAAVWVLMFFVVDPLLARR